MKNNLNKYKRALFFIWNSFKGHKKMFYIFFLGKTIEGIFYVVLPILAKLEMDQLVEKNEKLFGIIQLDSFKIFLVILFIIFLVKLLENFLRGFIELFEFEYSKIYENFYSSSLYKRLEGLEPGLFLNARNKKFIGEVISNISNIGFSIRELVGKVITNIFTIFGIIGVLIYIDIWIFVILLISSIIVYFIEKTKRKISEKQEYEDKYEYEHKIWIMRSQMEQNLTYLIGSGGFNLVFKYYKKFNDELIKRIKVNQKYNFILNILSFFVENLSDIGVKIVVGVGVFFSTTSIGTMTMVLLYSGKVNDLFEFFRTIKFDVDRFKDDLLKLDLLLDITEVKKDKNINVENFSKISFYRVNFKYPNFAKEELKYLAILENRLKRYGTKDSYIEDELHMIKEARKDLKQENPVILQDINLEFEVGKTYGLVGRNGAGKTTIISLLMNFFDDYNGNIKIDSKELNKFSRKFFEKNISVVNQVPYIIEGFTVRENLLLGVEKKYSDDFILGLLDKFGLKNKVLKARKGLDAEIGYGNDFSGGEKQLLAIARVILQDRKILIMDEGTNQLDAENEILVMNELLKNKKDKIVIFITHRMTTIRKVDLIYCIENGKITAIGKHNDLVNKDNIYSNFWKKQVEE